MIDNLIDRDKAKLLLPQQLSEEVERNRFEKWYMDENKGSRKRIENLNREIEKKEKELTNYSNELKTIKKKLRKRMRAEEIELANIQKRYRNLNSKANQKLKSLFGQGEHISESEDIILLARLRHSKGNPPYNENKIGDALIWESLLRKKCKGQEF